MLMNRLLTRREMLQRAGGGLGWLAFASMLSRDNTAANLNPLAPKAPHFKPRAKNVIWIFANGGPSQVDTWDYKPGLAKRDGQNWMASTTKPAFSRTRSARS